MLSPISDLIVIVPGIMGSSLVDRNGQELWSASPGALLRIVRLARNFKKIRLPDGIGDDHPDDGVSAPQLMPIVHVVGKLLGSDSYEPLIGFLKNRFELFEPTAERPGNLIRFPYDWRLSNRYNGKRIETELVPELERWRKASGNKEAKFVFICHSMGGLVARWFIEVLGGRECTRRLITIGTPHRGAIEALVKLSSGLSFGPIDLQLTEIIRSLPAAHQLLPTWKCIETLDGLKRIDEATIPDLNLKMATDALDFHATISKAVEMNSPEVYRKLALKGIEQPTAQSARLSKGGIERVYSYNNRDFKGDGTVPRQSSHPPEWANDESAGAFGQQHAMLQSDTNLHRQLFAILTADALEVFAAAGDQLGIELPELVERQSPLVLVATSATGDTTLPLRAIVRDEAGHEIESTLMRNVGFGRYEATFHNLPAGLVTVAAGSASRARPLHSVVGTSLVWDYSLGKEMSV